MKKLLLLGCLLSAPAHATLTSYSFTGNVDRNDSSLSYTTLSGSFVYDDAAEYVWNDVQSEALSNFTLYLDQDSFVSPLNPKWFATGGANIVDLPVVLPTHGGNFFWDPRKWGISLYSSSGYSEIGGKTTSVQSSPFHDAAPTPEPSSLVLFGSALAAFAAYRRKKKA